MFGRWTLPSLPTFTIPTLGLPNFVFPSINYTLNDLLRLFRYKSDLDVLLNMDIPDFDSMVGVKYSLLKGFNNELNYAHYGVDWFKFLCWYDHDYVNSYNFYRNIDNYNISEIETYSPYLSPLLSTVTDISALINQSPLNIPLHLPVSPVNILLPVSPTDTEVALARFHVYQDLVDVQTRPNLSIISQNLGVQTSLTSSGVRDIINAKILSDTQLDNFTSGARKQLKV